MNLDIDIPERGRKRFVLILKDSSEGLFRYRYPREGTETDWKPVYR